MNPEDAWLLRPDLLGAHIEPGKFQLRPHVTYIGERIADAVARGSGRLIISAPPRHGKSWLSSWMTPVWFLTLFPEKSVGIITYSDGLSTDFGRRIRNSLSTHAHELGVSIAQDSSAKHRFHTQQGGELKAVTRGGDITGRGFDLMLLDDLVKNDLEAYSPTYHRQIKSWWDSTASTRLMPGGTCIILMTRWHENDLPGQLIREQHQEGGEQWEVINVPALAEENDPLGREPGEALWEERYSRASLEARRARNPVWFDALYQGKPRGASDDSPLNADDIRFWKPGDLPDPRELAILQSWDTSFKGMDPTKPDKSGKRSKTAGLVAGRKGATIWALECDFRHMDFNEQSDALQDAKRRFPQTRKTYVEDEANGAALISSLREELPGLIPVIPKGSKFFRLAAVAQYFKAGNFLLPDTPWGRDVASRLCQFPNVEWDDDIDAISQLLSQEFLPDEDESTAESKRRAIEQLGSVRPPIPELPRELTEQSSDSPLFSTPGRSTE